MNINGWNQYNYFLKIISPKKQLSSPIRAETLKNLDFPENYRKKVLTSVKFGKYTDPFGHFLKAFLCINLKFQVSRIYTS